MSTDAGQQQAHVRAEEAQAASAMMPIEVLHRGG
jgi:hypothetical protein